MNSMNAQIRRAIRVRLAERDLKQRDLADLLGMKPQYVSRLMTGDVGKVPDAWQKVLDRPRPRARRPTKGRLAMARKRTTKRGNGEGTVSKRKDGRWEAKLTIGYNPNGTQKRATVYGKTQAEARKKLDALKEQLAAGTYGETRTKLSAYLETWKKHKAATIKPTTKAKYEYCVARINEHIGGTGLRNLKPLHIQAALHAISEKNGTPSANNCRRVLFNAMKQAVRWQLLTRNPVEAVDPLKEVRREAKIWTAKEAARFLDAAESDRLYALYYLAMATGLRRGELLGLRWTDINGNLINVTQTAVKAGNDLILSTPKTKSGRRGVAIATDVLHVLEEHQKSQDAERTHARDAWSENGLVFTDELGNLYPPDKLRHGFLNLIEAAGVPEVHLHDLRHLHASMCIRGGMDPKMLADRLGHARASFTLDTYTHLYEALATPDAVGLAALLNATKIASGTSPN